MLLIIIQIILVIAKLFKVITFGWWILLMPLYTLFFRRNLFLSVQCAFIIGKLLSEISWSWWEVFIPFYLYVLVCVMRYFYVMFKESNEN